MRVKGDGYTTGKFHIFFCEPDLLTYWFAETKGTFLLILKYLLTRTAKLAQLDLIRYKNLVKKKIGHT